MGWREKKTVNVTWAFTNVTLLEYLFNTSPNIFLKILSITSN